MSLRTVRATLQTALKDQLPQFRVYPDLRSVITVPAVVMTLSTGHNEKSADYDGKTFGATTWYIDMIVMVPNTNLETAQRTLDALVSPDEPGSIPAILDSRNRQITLESSIDIVRIRELRDYGGEYSAADIPHIGACLKLEVEESTC